MESTKTKKHSKSKEIKAFSIIPRVYEEELDRSYGVELRSMKNGEESGLREALEENVFFREGFAQSTHQIRERILKKYESTPGFCAMRVDDMKDLLGHVKNIYRASYENYIFGKESNMKAQFPNLCCGISSRNLFLTLMEKGYPNASLLHNYYQDHVYVGLPFVFGEKEQKGFIVIDPTSDQLFNDKKIAPRNNLFVVSGNRWKYKTDWKNGENLYPSSRDDSLYSNLQTLREDPCDTLYESLGIKGYFAEVFKTLVEVRINTDSFVDRYKAKGIKQLEDRVPLFV